MRNLLLGMTAAAAFALAVPGTALAQQDHGGRSGRSAHVSGGGSAHVGSGRVSGNARISGNVSGSHRMSNREFSHGSRHHFRSDRVRTRDFAAVDTRSFRRDRVASNNWRHDRHHGHHRHHRNFNFIVDTPGFYYDDYASNDTCYQYVWTRWGYRYVNTCTSYYYNVY